MDYTLIEVSAIPPEPVDFTPDKKGWIWAHNKIDSDVVARPRKLTPTTVKLTDLSGVQHDIGNATRYYLSPSDNYNYTDTDDPTINIKGSLIGDMTACGQSGNVLNGWRVPSIYIDGSGSEYYPYTENIGGLQSVYSKTLQLSLTFTPDFQIWNNKARYGQSVTCYVYNPGSGAIMSKPIYDIIDRLNVRPSSQSYTAYGTIGADITPNGSPVFAWNYYNGQFYQLNRPVESLKGCQWRKVTLIAQGINGEAWSNYDINNQYRDIHSNGNIAGTILGTMGAGVVGGAGAGLKLGGPIGAAIGAVGGGIAGLIGGVKSYTSASEKVREQLALLNAQSQSSAINIQSQTMSFFRDTDDNNFYTLISCYDAADMRSFDEFLTRYGYNVGNATLTKRHFWCRPDFVFIQVNSITIKSPNAGSELIEKVNTQLKAGVRIWRVKPNINSLMRNGNRDNNSVVTQRCEVEANRS